MAENTAISWTEAERASTGRQRGAYKSAARRAGVSIDEWFHRRHVGGQRWCFRCRSWKAKEVFSVDASRCGGLASQCKPCTSTASTASRYGMSFEEFAAFRIAHGEACGICAGTNNLYVDHDHVTGKVRGLLCPGCNTAIGALKEAPAMFAVALAYLEKHRG